MIPMTPPSPLFPLWNRSGRQVSVRGADGEELRALFADPSAGATAEVEVQLVARRRPRRRTDDVVVLTGDLEVGTLYDRQVEQYAGVLAELGRRGQTATTTAELTAREPLQVIGRTWFGIPRTGPGFGVSPRIGLDHPHLALPRNREPRQAYRLLPFGSPLQVQGEEDHLDLLERFRVPDGECMAYATLHAVRPGNRWQVEVRIDELPVGQLTASGGRHFLPLLHELTEAEVALAAPVLVTSSGLAAEVVLYAERGHRLPPEWVDQPIRQFFPLMRGHAPIPPRPERIVWHNPPGWPDPPEPDWEPGPDWLPDPEWPVAPEGWRYWVAR